MSRSTGTKEPLVVADLCHSLREHFERNTVAILSAYTRARVACQSVVRSSLTALLDCAEGWKKQAASTTRAKGARVGSSNSTCPSNQGHESPILELGPSAPRKGHKEPPSNHCR
jgi:hypothetical protein